MPKRQVKPDEEYVVEILKAVPRGLSNYEFMCATQKDWNAGWRDEVSEARRRYFAVNKQGTAK